ncbi:hypothetical protein GCM10011583_74840 [Streptomyces camponoticapitis]|uniref:Uncharacterized protein n=1 Tax=Streptomyces camponoticapitis TaxID=1616125 RepID=A0ABQ2F167_9ACTN|nr:hypothetical protein [Streptomyces camponoticapitis]GGK32098.1 hypothetical protein GCM10011583_74840 [Streptomyces camponoticapitis]
MLSDFTQPDLERWTSDADAGYRDETGHFVRRSVQHHHARGLTYGTTRWMAPSTTTPCPPQTASPDCCWSSARKRSPPSADSLSSTSTSTSTTTPSRVTFGTSPVVLPEPLAALVRELVATRRGKAKIGTPEDVPWLFPGGRPGHPLGDDRIGQRLHKIGIRPRQDRSTALFTLAAELPAAILARVLGIHIQVAVQWQKASAGDWASYAADVSRRVPENQ